MAHQPFERIGDNNEPVPPGAKGQPAACARRAYNHEWADYKTSLLIQELSVTPATHTRLLNFLTGIGVRLCGKIGLNLDSQIQGYIRTMRIPIHYPVGQNTLGVMRNVNAVSRDFYAFMNVLKEIWLKINTNDIPAGVYHDMINLIQQQGTFRLIGTFRGVRRDRKDNFTLAELTDNQVGITNIRDSFLKRNLEHLGFNSNAADAAGLQGWLHWGEPQCRLPYRGKYGQLIRENTEENGFFGSYKCGISGSVNYLLYLYLMSIVGNDPRDIAGNMNDLIDNLVLSCCLYLAGDGGHTIREILYGLILCFSLLDRLRIEYVNIDLPIENRRVYETFFTGNVTRFITAFCNRFAHINITGVVEADLPQDVRDHKDARFRAYTTIIIRAMCYNQFLGGFDNRDDSWGYIQSYLALDRDRYRQNNFLHAANETIRGIVTRLDGNMIDRVTARLQDKFRVCGVDEIANLVPFSFNAKNSPNKKKSVSKKKSPKKKSPKKKSVSKKKNTKNAKNSPKKKKSVSKKTKKR
jgi:hypothetical protein